ncbi:MAG: transposase [Myxococcales bacterium]|nr:transposase [Myxococcales bacterium]
MRRHALTDEQWARLVAVIPKQQRGPSAKIGDRQFVDAVLFRAKTGLPWRDLPERFGPWKASTIASTTGLSAVIGNSSLRRCRFVSINPDLLLMAVTSAPTKMPRVEKGARIQLFGS